MHGRRRWPPELRRSLAQHANWPVVVTGEDSALWMRERGFESSPASVLAFEPIPPGIFRPRVMRTYVRATSRPALLSRTSGSGNRGQPIVGRDASAPRYVHHRGRRQGPAEVRAPLGHFHRPLRPVCEPARTFTSEHDPPAERDPGRTLDVQSVNLKERLYRQGLLDAAVLTMRPGRDVGTASGMSLILDHINGVSKRQPDREPADRVSRTARRRSTRIADGSCRSTARTASAFIAVTPFGQTTRRTGIARPPAAADGTGRASSSRARGARSGHRSTSCSR